MKFRVLYLILFFSTHLVEAQIHKGPVAKFYFNDLKDYDEVSGRKVKLVGVSHARDRFDNKNNAIYIYANASSYINLGNYPALKPKAGSISLWVKMESENWAGTGREMNPIIITKNGEGNDFYEAYNINYFPDNDKAVAICSLDSTDQVVISSVEKFSLFTWHQLAITYDNHFFCFYIDGKLEQKQVKNFETHFLNTDSVVVGVTANKKNNRFSHCFVDDIEFYDRVLSPEEIRDLFHAPNPNRFNIFVQRVLTALGFIGLIAAIYFFFRFLAIKKERQRLKLNNIVLETELRVNRALMNPHFVFNSLNALQNFILQNENAQANNYLVKFSKLLRRILESNMSETITLEFEIELINRYLEIENLRFKEDIRHFIHVDPGLKPAIIKIPIMMLQPFIENAIWHGLLKKEGEKWLRISFQLFESKYLLCSIEDNGIGRKGKYIESLENRSLATGFIEQRLKLLNKLYNLKCNLTIDDRANPTGTLVKIVLPVLNK